MWIIMRIKAFAHGFLYHATSFLLFFLLADMSIPPLDGAVQHHRLGRLPLWWLGRISDGASVCHFHSRGARASGRGERVGGQRRWPEIGVRPERLREKGDE